MANLVFAKSASQAASVMKEVQGRGNVIQSVGTVRNYEQSLKLCCDYLKDNRLGSLRDLTPDIARQYLEHRAIDHSQSTINMDRQAIQMMMIHVTHQIQPTETLIQAMGLEKVSDIASEKILIEQSRSYTPQQIDRINSHLSEKNAFSVQLCQAAGLRAHELLTIRPLHEQPPNEKPPHSDKFSHLPKDSVPYTVNGKGGLIREVQIPVDLAAKLETYRLSTPQQVTDRNINITSHYNIGGGKPFSDAFSYASKNALNYSHGAHGLRHTYAQDRYEQLANYFPRSDVMEIISQELGHFRPEITEVYLR